MPADVDFDSITAASITDRYHYACGSGGIRSAGACLSKRCREGGGLSPGVDASSPALIGSREEFHRFVDAPRIVLPPAKTNNSSALSVEGASSSSSLPCPVRQLPLTPINPYVRRKNIRGGKTPHREISMTVGVSKKRGRVQTEHLSMALPPTSRSLVPINPYIKSVKEPLGSVKVSGTATMTPPVRRALTPVNPYISSRSLNRNTKVDPKTNGPEEFPEGVRFERSRPCPCGVVTPSSTSPPPRQIPPRANPLSS